MNTIVTTIIQARMASTRLPGKVMKEVLGRPLLGYLIERLQCCRRVQNIILATTMNPEDDPVAKLAKGFGLQVFRGSENNVLDRFYQAATMFGAEHIMRITADCPLIDPDLLDTLIEYYFASEFDYVSNCAHPTLPDGLDAEIFTFKALEDAYKNAVRPSCLEHVTPYIRNYPERFKIGSWSFSMNLSHLRWTVDEPEDFQFVCQVIEKLYPANKYFRTNDILSLLNQEPGLIQINTHIARNEGFLKSLAEDKRWSNNQNI